MSKRCLACSALAFALGCGGGSASIAPATAPPPRDPRSCAHVADHVMSLMSEQARQAPMETQDALRRAFRERCDQDAWSPAVRDCFLQLADLEGGEACARQMTEAQVQAMDRAVGEALGDTPGPAATPAPTPDADDGSGKRP